MPKAKVFGQLGLDPTLPNVTLKIGDKTYHLGFDFNACAQVQAVTGVNVFAPQSDVHLDPVKFRAMLWASLLREHPDMTILDAGRLITPKTLPAVAEAVSQAWSDSQAEPETGNE